SRWGGQPERGKRSPVLRRHGTSLRTLLMLADAAVATVVLIAVYLLRYRVDSNPPPPVSYVWAPVVLYSITWVVLLYLVGEYRLRAHWTLRSEIVGIAKATFWLAGISIAALFLSDLTFISRVFLIILFPVQWLVTVGMRAVLRWMFIEMRKRG